MHAHVGRLGKTRTGILSRVHLKLFCFCTLHTLQLVPSDLCQTRIYRSSPAARGKKKQQNKTPSRETHRLNVPEFRGFEWQCGSCVPGVYMLESVRGSRAGVWRLSLTCKSTSFCPFRNKRGSTEFKLKPVKQKKIYWQQLSLREIK